MLIPSERHTDADLALWDELEEADRLHGKSDIVARKVERSLRVIREFSDAGPCYCSVSWGKDSVVALHMAKTVNPSIPVLWVKNVPLYNPDCIGVRDAFAPSHYREIEHQWSSGDEYLMPGVEQFERESGLNRRVTGLRAEESAGRKISMRHRGLSTDNSCRPLGWWTVEDVFGYMAIHDLPVHPAYAMTGGGRWDRHHLRVDALGGDENPGDMFGNHLWEREYYGDVLARIQAGAR